MKNLTLLTCIFCLPIFSIAQVSFVFDSIGQYEIILKIAPEGGWVTFHQNTVTKYNSCREIEWSNNYSLDSLPNYITRLHGINITNDGDILINGDFRNTINTNIFGGSLLLKIDPQGIPSWCNLYSLYDLSGNNIISLFLDDLEISPNGDYFLKGINNLVTTRNIHVLRMDADGFPIWNKQYQIDSVQIRQSSLSCSDGGLIVSIAGRDVHVTTNGMSYIVKINTMGEILWSSTVSRFVQNFIEVEDGFVCSTNNQIFKIDMFGNLLWQSKFIDLDFFTLHGDFFQLHNGNFVNSSFTFPPVKILRTIWSPEGEILKQSVNSNISVNSSSSFAVPINRMDLFPDNSLLVSNFSKIARTDTLQNLSCFDSIINPSLIDYELVLNSIPSTLEEDVSIFTQSLGVQAIPNTLSPEVLCEEFYISDTQVDTFICEDETLNFDVNFYGAQSFLWQDGSTSPEIEITSPGTYSVEITHCEYTVTKIFNVAYKNCACFSIANIFTPDGDGMNDSFAPIFNCGIQNFTFQIFNRWGELVFSTNSIEEKWDGTFNNKPATTDVYVYKLLYEDQFGEMQNQNGDVTLIR